MNIGWYEIGHVSINFDLIDTILVEKSTAKKDVWNLSLMNQGRCAHRLKFDDQTKAYDTFYTLNKMVLKSKTLEI